MQPLLLYWMPPETAAAAELQLANIWNPVFKLHCTDSNVLSFWEGEAGAKPIVLQYHEQLKRLRIRTYLLSTTPCVLRLELIYAKYATQAGGGVGLLGSGQTLHLLRVPPIGALTFYFPSLRSIVKSLRANHCPPQCLASELEMSQCCDVFCCCNF